MLGLAFASVLGAGSSMALAHSDATPSTGYLIDSSKHYVKNNYGECWRTGYWTPALAVAECDPDLVKKEEPAAMPAPAMVEGPGEPVGPAKPAFEKVTLQAETLFDFDKAVVRPDGKKILDDEVVAKMKEYPQVEVVLVTGHADRIGSDRYNMRLSQRRADAVKGYLTSEGIDANRVETAAKGESEPVVDCNDVKGKANRYNKKLVECLQPNRRVVVEIKVQKATQ
jgi:OOP family OmpA-OmpF porin